MSCTEIGVAYKCKILERGVLLKEPLCFIYVYIFAFFFVAVFFCLPSCSRIRWASDLISLLLSFLIRILNFEGIMKILVLKYESKV